MSGAARGGQWSRATSGAARSDACVLLYSPFLKEVNGEDYYGKIEWSVRNEDAVETDAEKKLRSTGTDERNVRAKKRNRFSSRSWKYFQSFTARCIAALSTSGRPSPVMLDHPRRFASPSATTVPGGRRPDVPAHALRHARARFSSFFLSVHLAPLSTLPPFYCFPSCVI